MLEKETYLNSLGLSTMAIESMKCEEDVYEEVLKREKDVQGQLIANKIDKSRYNERYKQIMIIGKPEYLTKECRNYKVIIERIEYRDLEKIWEGKNNNEIAKWIKKLEKDRNRRIEDQLDNRKS